MRGSLLNEKVINLIFICPIYLKWAPKSDSYIVNKFHYMFVLSTLKKPKLHVVVVVNIISDICAKVPIVLLYWNKYEVGETKTQNTYIYIYIRTTIWFISILCVFLLFLLSEKFILKSQYGSSHISCLSVDVRCPIL